MDRSKESRDDDQVKQIQATFESICQELSVDKKVADIAWRGFDAVRKQCTLEGDQVPWLACSVYVACWLCPPASVSDQGRKVPPLTIVETCNLSIVDFFEKLQKWVDMANMSRKFQDQVIKMESSYAVTSVIYKKFETVFNAVFANPAEAAQDLKGGGSRAKRGKRAAPVAVPQSQQQQYGFNQLMEFSWLLYIYAKRCFVGLGDDIMSSYHMLLCALDTIYTDIVQNKRKDLVSSDFEIKEPLEDNAVIENLCKIFEGIVLDAKHMRIHWWRPKLKTFITDGILKGDTETLSGVLSAENFEHNLKSLHERYDEAILKRGDMDERVFIPKHASNALIISPASKKKRGESESDGEDSLDYERELMFRRNVQACLDRVNQYQAPSAHTHRGFPLLSGEQFCPISPVISQSAAKVQSLVADCSLGPNPELKAMLNLIRPNPAEMILRVVQNATDAFLHVCTQEAQGYTDSDEHFSEFANHCREVAEMLYYRILEKIIQTEKERQPAVDLGAVLNQEVFHKSLFACSTELVLYSYNSEKLFPWVLEILDLPAFYFYKVIELVIRAESDFSREMVKHLNDIEERCLEEYVWTRNSPLWEVLTSTEMPSYDEITVSNGVDGFGVGIGRADHGKQPVIAKRRLDFEPGGGSPMTGGAASRSVAADHQTLRINPIQLPGSSGPPVGLSSSQSRADNAGTSGKSKPITNSLALFFRKVYYMATLRLSDLCDRLRIYDSLKLHSWTMFDHIVRKQTEMVKGRHLDQILMCAIYIMAKVMKQDISFQDIMCSYRSQPQAKSRVYRNVLLDQKSTTPTDEVENHDRPGGEKLRSGSTLPIPAITSAPPTPTPAEEEYGDLIKFYNQVFVTKMEETAKKLSATGDETGDNEGAMPLSPMPILKSQSLSPRRRVADAVFVSPMKTGFVPQSPTRPLRYSFSRSPYKDLRAINNMLRAGGDHSPIKMIPAAAYTYARRPMPGEASHMGMGMPLRRY